MDVRYPSIVRRYLSTLIDSLILLAIFLFLISIEIGDGTAYKKYQFAGAILIVLIYEPVLTSKLCTIGQYLAGIRIRRMKDYARISIPSAYLRYLVKILLGLYSFFSVLFSERYRAVHDFASGTVVIRPLK